MNTEDVVSGLEQKDDERWKLLDDFYAMKPPPHPLGRKKRGERCILVSDQDWKRIDDAAKIAGVSKVVLITVAARCLADRLIEGREMLKYGQVQLWKDIGRLFDNTPAQYRLQRSSEGGCSTNED